MVRCDRGVWKDASAAAACETTCPEAYAPEAPDACARTNAATLRCEYEEEGYTCGCAVPGAGPDAATDAAVDTGDGGDGSALADGAVAYVWKCVQAEAGCPRTRPHYGAPCVRPMTCDYGDCLFGSSLRMTCSGGFWETYDGSCPR
jgi:hypothetical protein